MGRALSFGGSNGYVRISDKPGLEPDQDVTLAAWVYLTSFNPPGYHSGIIYKPGRKYGCCFQPAYGLGVSAYGYLFFALGDDSTYAVLYGPKIPLNTWIHLAAVRRKGSMKIYVNGAEAANGFNSLSTLTDSAAPLLIGKSEGGWGGNPFDGLIDEVEIHSKALSASEVHSLMAR
jgi:hypothetical protein